LLYQGVYKVASVFLKTSAFITALLMLLGAGAQTARAQEQQPSAAASSSSSSSALATATGQQSASQQSSTSSAPEAADLSITANVTARELRFDVVPDPRH
jgi:hypothetical protein